MGADTTSYATFWRVKHSSSKGPFIFLEGLDGLGQNWVFSSVHGSIHESHSWTVSSPTAFTSSLAVPSNPVLYQWKVNVWFSSIVGHLQMHVYSAKIIKIAIHEKIMYQTLETQKFCGSLLRWTALGRVPLGGSPWVPWRSAFPRPNWGLWLGSSQVATHLCISLRPGSDWKSWSHG